MASRNTAAHATPSAGTVANGGTNPRRPGPRYPDEFKAEAVRLARTNTTSRIQLARELGVSQDTLRAWVRQAEIDTGRRDGLTTEERQELTQLRREVKRLQEEREILKKATAFFAAESATR
jgi:transposase